MPSSVLSPIELSADERAQLESWTRGRTSAQALALRSRIVLLAAEGRSNVEIAKQLGVQRNTVAKWRSRFLEHRLDGLTDEPRPGQPRKIGDAKVEEVVVKTLETTPKDATHWSTRSMAAEVGLNQTAVHRIWKAFGLQPHRPATWKLARTRSSSRRSAMSSGSISTRPSARSCCASTRSPRSRRWTGPRRSCRCFRACPSARRTTTSAQGPPASTPRWTSPPAR